jgi:beta-lactamase superfamily II metal-dependent hydrolase
MGYEVDFLPVGNGGRSGDAIAMRFGDLRSVIRSQQTVIVIDGGFKESGEKLVEHIRNYYLTDSVDIVVSSHPDQDHVSGLTFVLENMKVGELWMHQPWKHTSGISDMFKSGRVTDSSVREALRKSLDMAYDLEQLATSRGIPTREPFAGHTDRAGAIRIVSPSVAFYEGLLPEFRGTPEPKTESGFLRKAMAKLGEVVGTAMESLNVETLSDTGTTSAENETSVVMIVQTGDSKLLFTGDAGRRALAAAADFMDNAGIGASTSYFVQVPHHGSHKNVGPTILDRLLGPKRPDDGRTKAAFVSVADGDEKKHPAKQVSNAFRRRGAPVIATLGQAKCSFNDAPSRQGWSPVEPLPLYPVVDVYDD